MPFAQPTTNLSRRSILWTTLAPAFAASRPAKPRKAFALVGDRYHNSDYIRTALSRTLVRDTGIDIVFTDEVRQLSAATLRQYSLFILFRDGMLWPDGYEPEAWLNGYEVRGPGTGEFEFKQGWYPGYTGLKTLPIQSEPPLPETTPKPAPWMSLEQGRAIREFVQSGGGLLAYHNTPYISRDNKDFRETIGAITLGHPPMRPFRVKIANAEHPITRGVGDFLITDEQHFVEFERSPESVLLRSVNEDGLAHLTHGPSSPAGWAFDVGKGRVCYLAPGHTIQALWNPEYVKIQRNAARWLLREI